MTQVSIQLPDDLKRRAERLAHDRGTSLDQVVRDALTHELDPLDGCEIVDGRPVITADMAQSMTCPFPPEPDL